MKKMKPYICPSCSYRGNAGNLPKAQNHATGRTSYYCPDCDMKMLTSDEFCERNRSDSA